jgi:hypothetical protein
MGDSLKRGISEKSARPFNRMNGAENAGQQRCVLRVFFDLDQFPIQAREVFVTLDKELANHFLILYALILHGARRHSFCAILCRYADDFIGREIKTIYIPHFEERVAAGCLLHAAGRAMRETGEDICGTRMDLKKILEMLGQEHVPGDEMTGGFLDDAVASFAENPAGATNSIRQLRASDPSGFVLAAVRLLTSKEEKKSPGIQYVAGLMFAGNVLADALLDRRILTLEAATSLARNLTSADPLLDAHLIHKMLANAGGEIPAVPRRNCVARTLAGGRDFRLLAAIFFSGPTDAPSRRAGPA